MEFEIHFLQCRSVEDLYDIYIYVYIYKTKKPS